MELQMWPWVGELLSVGNFSRVWLCGGLLLEGQLRNCHLLPGEPQTIVDPDVGITDDSWPYCDGAGHSRPCTFIYYNGLETECISLGHPDECHQYVRVANNVEATLFLAQLNFTGQVDANVHCLRPAHENAQRSDEVQQDTHRSSIMDLLLRTHSDVCALRLCLHE